MLSTGYIAIQWISVNKTNYAIHRIVIYPVDSVIHPLNNRALDIMMAGWLARWTPDRAVWISTPNPTGLLCCILGQDT